MVENLLSITRMGGGSYCLRKNPEMPEEIISEAVGKFRKNFLGTVIEAKAPEVCLEVPMDAMLIEQVLYNLMENAAIHGKASTILLRVSKEKERAWFSVRDNGAGISAEKLEHLWGDYMDLADDSIGDKKHNFRDRSQGV